jgi:aspartyl protease family protein
MAAEAIPVATNHGVPEVEVLLNGKVKQTMIWDSGATLVTLSAETAASLGIHPTSRDRTIRATLADGREVACKLVRLESIRVGPFTVQDVECAVPADGKGGTDLLGDAFQSHFMCKMDMRAGLLRLTPLTKQPETPGAGDAQPRKRDGAKPVAKG